jgi:hypothetical protein
VTPGPPAGFELVRRVDGDVYTVIVYRTPTGPAPVPLGALFGLGQGLSTHVTLVSQPATLPGR